jgi:hypothetical protein
MTKLMTINRKTVYVTEDNCVRVGSKGNLTDSISNLPESKGVKRKIRKAAYQAGLYAVAKS